MPSALTVAGSDSSGGAGIQADLRTFSLFGVEGLSVITALTAQHSRGILGVLPVPPDFVGLQLDAVLLEARPEAMKTGMLHSTATVERVAAFVSKHGIRNLVVDPVLVSTSGTALVEPATMDAVIRRLLPLATLVTPNLAEAEGLTGTPVRNLDAMENAARRLVAMGAAAALVKGGHLDGDAIDVLFDGVTIRRFPAPRIDTPDNAPNNAPNNHGTGCVLSAAIAAQLALGRTLPHAIQTGKDTVAEMLRRKNGLAP